ncbi:hypothetical protein NBRC116493_02470 [Aurantivibrio infirmus]
MKKKNIVGGMIYGLIFLVFLMIAYYWGVFTTSFNTNMCYSEVFWEIKAEVGSAINSEDTEELQNVEKLLNDLPLHGYESSCDEIKKYLSL